MKISRLLIIATTCALAVSCEKAPTEAERNAQIEKEVQARIASEHQADDQQRLAQQQAELDAREKALAARETSTVAKRPVATATAVPRTTKRVSSSSSSEASTPRSYDTFYRKLEPYGAWRETGDYGYVWQPREAQSRNWKPYTDGRWAYTDAGWTWVSDEPFGWATYHYGRWTRLRDVGWVWVPGEEWAPAWVSWRKGEQNVGWAPLPPEARFDRNKGIHKWADSYYDIDAGEYVFIPNEEIGAENVQRAVIPTERNVTIVNQTTNVTNITYANTTIVNEGPSYDELRAQSRRPLQRMRIEREYDVERDEAPRASISGEVIQMVTPLFSARATERPRTSAPAIRQVTVERATVVRSPEADAARAKMKSENAPPSDAPSKKFEKPIIAEGTPAPVSAATPVATATAVATTTPVATATPVAQPAATATATATVAPTTTPAASATPVPTATPATPTATPATPTATPATPTATPATPTATPRPRFSPRATPSPSAEASMATATPSARVMPTATATAPVVPTATATPRIVPTATPEASTPAPRVVPTPVPVPSIAITPAESAPATPNESAERAAMKVEQQRKRQEAMQQMMDKRRGTAASPSPDAEASPPAPLATVPPRRVPPPRPTLAPANPVAPEPAAVVTPPPVEPLATPASAAMPPADQIQGTPAGIEMTHPPTGAAKRRPPMGPRGASPSPTASPSETNEP